MPRERGPTVLPSLTSPPNQDTQHRPGLGFRQLAWPSPIGSRTHSAHQPPTKRVANKFRVSALLATTGLSKIFHPENLHNVKSTPLKDAPVKVPKTYVAVSFHLPTGRHQPLERTAPTALAPTLDRKAPHLMRQTCSARLRRGDGSWNVPLPTGH